MLEGGFGYYDFNYTLKSPSGDESTSFNTSASARRGVLSEESGVRSSRQDGRQRARPASAANAAASGTTCLAVRANNPAAGYNKVKGSLGHSQSCNLALWLYKDQIEQPITVEDMLEGSKEVIRDEHHFIEIGRGHPIAARGMVFSRRLLLSLRALLRIAIINQLTTTDRDSMRKWLIDNMVTIQDPGGSWTDFPLYGYHPLLRRG